MKEGFAGLNLTFFFVIVLLFQPLNSYVSAGENVSIGSREIEVSSYIIGSAINPSNGHEYILIDSRSPVTNSAL